MSEFYFLNNSFLLTQMFAYRVRPNQGMKRISKQPITTVVGSINFPVIILRGHAMGLTYGVRCLVSIQVASNRFLLPPWNTFKGFSRLPQWRQQFTKQV